MTGIIKKQHWSIKLWMKFHWHLGKPSVRKICLFEWTVSCCWVLLMTLRLFSFIFNSVEFKLGTIDSIGGMNFFYFFFWKSDVLPDLWTYAKQTESNGNISTPTNPINVNLFSIIQLPVLLNCATVCRNKTSCACVCERVLCLSQLDLKQNEKCVYPEPCLNKKQ